MTEPRVPQQYEDFMRHVHDHGVVKADRTCIQMRARASDGVRDLSDRFLCTSANKMNGGLSPKIRSLIVTRYRAPRVALHDRRISS